MHISTIFAAALGAASLSAAAPTLDPRNTVIYATFYNDNACKSGGGKAVSTGNPGCLNESGRKSIYFQKASTDRQFNLVYSPSQNCPCQSYCYQTIVGNKYLPTCVDISNTPSAQSYRFVGDEVGKQSSCGPNNC